MAELPRRLSQCRGARSIFQMSFDRLSNDPRITVRRDGAPDPKGKCVVYWMQRAQRGVDNHAVDLAVKIANLLGLPLVVYFAGSRIFLTRIFGITSFSIRDCRILRPIWLRAISRLSCGGLRMSRMSNCSRMSTRHF